MAAGFSVSFSVIICLLVDTPAVAQLPSSFTNHLFILSPQSVSQSVSTIYCKFYEFISPVLYFLSIQRPETAC